MEEIKDHKSLQSYKYFTSGWVIEHRWKVFDDKEVCLIMGKVNHSYAMTSTPLVPWVIVKHHGTVVCRHCTCMAGLGETCSHISALLYWVEYMVRKREEESCTSKPNSWLEPRTTKHIPYLPLDTIDFTSSEKWMKAYQHGEVLTTCAESRARDVQSLPVHSSMVDTDTAEFYDSALAASSKPIVFSVFDEPDCSNFAKSASHLPVCLKSLYDPSHLQCTCLELIETGKQMKGLFESAPQHLAITHDHKDLKHIPKLKLITYIL